LKRALVQVGKKKGEGQQCRALLRTRGSGHFRVGVVAEQVCWVGGVGKRRLFLALEIKVGGERRPSLRGQLLNGADLRGGALKTR